MKLPATDAVPPLSQVCATLPLPASGRHGEALAEAWA